jgi:hypothetical protein
MTSLSHLCMCFMQFKEFWKMLSNSKLFKEVCYDTKCGFYCLILLNLFSGVKIKVLEILTKQYVVIISVTSSHGQKACTT